MEYKIKVDDLYIRVIRVLAHESFLTEDEVINRAFEKGLAQMAKDYLETLGGDL